MMKQLNHMISKLPVNDRTMELIKLSARFDGLTEEMYRNWGIPKSYLIFGNMEDLNELMENELIAPEDAGYYACDDTCCCQCGCCCDNCDLYDDEEDYDGEDYDDEDDEDEDEEDEEFAEGVKYGEKKEKSICDKNHCAGFCGYHTGRYAAADAACGICRWTILRTYICVLYSYLCHLCYRIDSGGNRRSVERLWSDCDTDHD